MAEVPVSNSELEDIVSAVAHELYSKWAVDDRFTEEQVEEFAGYAVEDAVFIIGIYMEKVNELMAEKQRQELLTSSNKSKLIVG